MGRSFKEMYKKYKQYGIKAKQQKNYSKSNFSFEKMQELVSNVLTANIPEFPKQVELTLPTLQKAE